MSRLTPEVTAVAQNSQGVYFQISTGKAGVPATVKRTRSNRVGRGGFTYWCGTCGMNDNCAHTRTASHYFDAYGATSPTPRAATSDPDAAPLASQEHAA